jgi:hypothetical protein
MTTLPESKVHSNPFLDKVTHPIQNEHSRAGGHVMMFFFVSGHHLSGGNHRSDTATSDCSTEFGDISDKFSFSYNTNENTRAQINKLLEHIMHQTLSK